MQSDNAMCDADELIDNDIIGVIKIKDGLFICDELGAQVSSRRLRHRRTEIQIGSGPDGNSSIES